MEYIDLGSLSVAIGLIATEKEELEGDNMSIHPNSEAYWSGYTFGLKRGYERSEEILQDVLYKRKVTEVMPVVRAKWKDLGRGSFSCTACSANTNQPQNQRLYMFCPHCGARMDA